VWIGFFVVLLVWMDDERDGHCPNVTLARFSTMIGPPNLFRAQEVRTPIVCPSNRLTMGAASTIIGPLVTSSTVNLGHEK
jgi:hypothetical protein